MLYCTEVTALERGNGRAEQNKLQREQTSCSEAKRLPDSGIRLLQKQDGQQALATVLLLEAGDQSAEIANS